VSSEANSAVHSEKNRRYGCQGFTEFWRIARKEVKMMGLCYVEGKPILTCSCGSQWWVSGTNRCWECGREASPAEIEEYEEACRDGRKE